jgi:hypothetical protein
MNHGTWSLVYRFKDWSEAGTFRDGVEDKMLPLNATTEDEAIIEGREKWAEIVAQANTEWEIQKATWHNPPKAIFNDEPPNPRIVYQFPLI